MVATGIDVKTQKIIDNKLINNFGDITLSKSISIDSITERNAIKEKKWKNAEELFNQPDVDGGLVGGASLKVDEFSLIIKALR